MDTKSSAHYQREYRKRLREKGLVKKEVWILPENGKRLLEIEKILRSKVESNFATGVKIMTDNNAKSWTTNELFESLKGEELFASGLASVELIDGVEPSLHIVMKEFGDLPVFLTVSGDQIIVDAVLWPITEVEDPASFNDAILRTHKYFPLSTISLDNAGGKDYYYMFGALSSSSILSNVVLEIEVLASNVIQATEAYKDFLSMAVEAS